jgi:hypothetical protein
MRKHQQGGPGFIKADFREERPLARCRTYLTGVLLVSCQPGKTSGRYEEP